MPYHTVEHFKEWVRANGLPVPIPKRLKDELMAASFPLPVVRGNIGLVFPPHVGDGDPDLVAWDDGVAVWHDETGSLFEREGHEIVILDQGGPRCAHCGSHVGEADGLMLHAVAGLEDATDAEGNPLRLLVRHCGGCAGSAFCDPDQASPGVSVPDGLPSGYCEPVKDGV